jgi:hypothetical protein
VLICFVDIEIMFDYFEVDPNNSEINATDFVQIFNHSRFDPVLKFVHFRNVRVKGKDAPQLLPAGASSSYLDDDFGRTDMKFFFDWFRYKKGVQRILSVTVEDMDDPHSDEAIEKCLENFQVEILDWRKEDLCPETIQRIGHNLTEIHLQWSGKNAVLRAWSEVEGLSQCEHLKTINLRLKKVSSSLTTLGNSTTGD